MRTSLGRLALSLVASVLILSCASSVVAQDATPGASPAASPTTGDPVLRAVAYLQSQQAADGGFLGFSGTGDPGVTADAVLALVAAGKAGVPVDVSAAVAFLTANGEAYALTGAGQAAKLVLALSAAGANPRDVGGFDAVATIVAGQDADSGVYGTGVYDHCLAMLSLVQAREPFADPEQTFEALRARQIPDGSWSFDGTATAGAGDSNTTAICIQALVAAGLAEDDMVQGGVDYLRSIQLPQGFPFQPGSGAVADANSTGIVVQALIAVGEDPSSEAWQNVGGSLLLFQNPSGAFRYTMEPPDDNLFATLQALPAIAGQAYPIAAGNGTPAALPEPQGTCTPEQLAATPGADAELPCAA
jgi:hypothetical protein